MTFFAAVDGAIDTLIRERPQLFNTSDVAGDRSYRVLDQDAYYQGLGETLGASGLCAQMDATKRLSFFGFNCEPGIGAPDKADHTLPMGCDGYLTATPKDPDGRDVPMQIHGSDIEWRFKKGEEFVNLRQWPDQPFNQTVYTVAPGFFKLCATVQGVSGCVGISVVP
jgi:hypothetical protein